MGWLRQFIIPPKYDPTWIQRLVESIRTAVNFVAASDVTQDANNRFVTDTDKANWNGKATTGANTFSGNQTVNGSLSISEDFDTTKQVNVNGNPEDSLYFVTTHAGGGNCYTYYKIASPNYVIQAGDYLEYDVFSDLGNTNGLCDGGCELDFSDSTNGRGFSILDQNNLSLLQSDHSAYSKGRWYHRKHSLANVVGKTISSFDLVEETDVAGTYTYYYRKIIITNGGNIKVVIWQGGAPSVNDVNYASSASNYTAGGSYFKNLCLVGLPIYANNAAAITGGLKAGALYRNGADPDLVCIVH